MKPAAVGELGGPAAEHAYSEWIGRSRLVQDTVTPRLLSQFRAIFDDLLFAAEVPPGMCWCLAPDAAAARQLGSDGHPEPGLFLPRLPLPRRMWAGGELHSIAPLAPDDLVARKSTIEKIVFKEGRTGPLGFVTIAHCYEVRGEPRILERQDIVYREDVRAEKSLSGPAEAEAWRPTLSWQITPDEAMLFRFSALTFNGHRIHYDRLYARDVEGYPGLVVHGPMQAIWLQNLASVVLGKPPGGFVYRSVAPLFNGEAVAVEALATAKMVKLRVRREIDNVVTMQGEAGLD